MFVFRKIKEMSTAQAKKLGCVIIMHPGQNNYGTSLQGFATLYKMSQMGADCEIIRYNKKRSISELIATLPGLIRSGAIQKFFYRLHKKWDLFAHREYRETRLIRTEAVNKFKKKYFDSISCYYTGFQNLQKGSLSYSAVMVGSDQVWGPLSLYSRFYNLLFVYESIPTFSYASSFGVSSIFHWQKEGVKEYLVRMDKIGVREDRGKEIVKELTDKDAKVVLDPTLLLTKDEWESHLDNNRCVVNEPYILCYVLGEREDIREDIKQISKSLNVKIVNLPHIDNYHKMDDGLGDIDLYDVDPFDFVRLVRDAEYVVTDSFHGTVFSLLMHKKFLTYYRQDPKKKGSTHSRIDSLLNNFGLRERIASNNSCEQLVADINYEFVDNKLQEMRDDSLRFMEQCLSLRDKS